MTDRALSLDDFRAYEPGQVVRLYYDLVNRGDFLWRHGSVEGERVVGEFRYDDMDEEWSKSGDYLYIFQGVVCRGSGAEPVWDRTPEPSTYWDEVEDADYYLDE